MIRNAIIAGLLSFMAMTAASADVKYYSRQALVNLAAPAPAAPPAPTYATCGTLVASQWVRGAGLTSLGAASSPAQAMSICNAYLKTNKITTTGACFYTSFDGNSYKLQALWSNGGYTYDLGDANYYGANCQ